MMEIRPLQVYFRISLAPGNLKFTTKSADKSTRSLKCHSLFSGPLMHPSSINRWGPPGKGEDFVKFPLKVLIYSSFKVEKLSFLESRHGTEDDFLFSKGPYFSRGVRNEKQTSPISPSLPRRLLIKSSKNTQ